MKILSLNTNRNTPLKEQLDLVEKTKPDVMCLQEVRKDIFIDWLDTFGYQGNFAPQWYEYIDGQRITVGSAIITSKEASFKNYYYRCDSDSIPYFNVGNIEQADIPRALQTALINANGDIYQVANLHFTWAPNGIPNKLQIHDAHKVLKILEGLKQFILCGDFNTPVGSTAFEIMRNRASLAELINCDSTIDQNYHYAKDLKIIVDAVLFTEPYILKDIALTCGVSDHCALIVNITKTNRTGR